MSGFSPQTPTLAPLFPLTAACRDPARTKKEINGCFTSWSRFYAKNGRVGTVDILPLPLLGFPSHRSKCGSQNGIATTKEMSATLEIVPLRPCIATKGL